MRSRTTGAPRFWARAAFTVARRPRLWPTALVQARRLVRPRWWLHAPFLPVPDPHYVRYRLETQYGPDHDPDPDDVATYLEWCRHMSRARPRTPR